MVKAKTEYHFFIYPLENKKILIPSYIILNRDMNFYLLLYPNFYYIILLKKLK